MKEMNNWSVVGDNDPYSPPENRLRYLHGEVNGEYVRTSPIVEINGNIITTKSGTNYKLLEPCAKYIEYLKKNGIELPTKEEPIRKKTCKIQ